MNTLLSTDRILKVWFVPYIVREAAESRCDSLSRLHHCKQTLVPEFSIPSPDLGFYSCGIKLLTETYSAFKSMCVFV